MVLSAAFGMEDAVADLAEPQFHGFPFQLFDLPLVSALFAELGLLLVRQLASAVLARVGDVDHVDERYAYDEDDRWPRLLLLSSGGRGTP